MLKWLSGILTTVLSGWILHDRLLHRLRSWSWHFLNSDISQGSVVTQLRCGEIISQGFVANFLMNLSVKEVWKSVNICRSYGQYCSALFFLTHSVVAIGCDEMHSWSMVFIATKLYNWGKNVSPLIIRCLFWISVSPNHPAKHDP